MKHVSLSVFNYSRKKLCDLFDSAIRADGQAYDIILTSELNGWKEISFNIPYMINKFTNFRWKFIRNEYQLRLRIDDKEDWFIIHSPKRSKNNKAISNNVKCSHISSILKTKNLYLAFDDTNGIGTLPFLMNRALSNTGWTLGECDTFYERDGETEKVRSLSTDGKLGSYQLISDICGQFNAYPVFNGDTKTVDVHALNNKLPMSELYVGKNLDALSVEYSSDDIITRLYVEGEYGDYGYVGIDDVNPTGLSYLLNFDYYKSIGLFTDEHQQILDTYLEKMSAAIATIKEIASSISEKENALNSLWGQINYMFYVLENGEVKKNIMGGLVPQDKMDIKANDSLIVLKAEGAYRTVTADENGNVDFEADDLYAIKYITKPSGNIGAKEVAIEAKEKLIKNLQKKLDKVSKDEEREKIREQIEQLESEISDIYNGTEDATGLYTLMHQAADLVMVISAMRYEQETALTAQENAEAEFALGMGDQLKDGYWTNTNYAAGQEEYLYADAVDMINQISKPSIAYTVSQIALSEQMGFVTGQMQLNSKARIYDSELEVNDIVYVTKIVRYLDNPERDTVEISNDDITLSGKTFDSILGRITKLADLIDQKNSLFSRAEAISGDGSIYMDRLNGTIDILKNKLLSTSSSWYTDDSGNIIFESVNGKSAMMLCGEGFMIAYGKTDDGDWNWRTFGTGEGFTADAIITGYLSADRIEAGSITVGKLSSSVGATIDQSENNSIKSVVESASKNIIYKGVSAPADPEIDTLWLDTSSPEQDVLKRWNGTEWIECTLSQGDIDAFYSTLSNYKSEIDQLSQSITMKVSSEKYNSDMANKADVDWITERLESIITQTSEDIMFQFNQSKEYVVEATEPFQEFMEDVRTYQRFSADGLELGAVGSPFQAKLGNTKLSFIQDGVEIAYISNNKLHITEARVTEKLSIGTEDNGYFDWITTSTGMALKWRG